MQFSPLFCIAASIALASAGVAQKRDAYSDDVAVITVYDHATDSCPTDDATVTIGVAHQVVGQCIPFSMGYQTVNVPALMTGYAVNFFTSDSCDNVIAQMGVSSGSCYPDTYGPWMAYMVVNDTSSD